MTFPTLAPVMLAMLSVLLRVAVRIVAPSPRGRDQWLWVRHRRPHERSRAENRTGIFAPCHRPCGGRVRLLSACRRARRADGLVHVADTRMGSAQHPSRTTSIVTDDATQSVAPPRAAWAPAAQRERQSKRLRHARRRAMSMVQAPLLARLWRDSGKSRSGQEVSL